MGLTLLISSHRALVITAVLELPARSAITVPSARTFSKESRKSSPATSSLSGGLFSLLCRWSHRIHRVSEALSDELQSGTMS